jgi:hypothetical protein
LSECEKRWNHVEADQLESAEVDDTGFNSRNVAETNKIKKKKTKYLWVRFDKDVELQLLTVYHISMQTLTVLTSFQ